MAAIRVLVLGIRSTASTRFYAQHMNGGASLGENSLHGKRHIWLGNAIELIETTYKLNICPA